MIIRTDYSINYHDNMALTTIAEVGKGNIQVSRMDTVETLLSNSYWTFLTMDNKPNHDYEFESFEEVQEFQNEYIAENGNSISDKAVLIVYADDPMKHLIMQTKDLNEEIGE